MQNGYEFLEKMKTLHFFQSDIWADIYVVLIGPSHFKTNSFQELCTLGYSKHNRSGPPSLT